MLSLVDFYSYKSLKIPLTTPIDYKLLAKIYCLSEHRWPQLAAFNFYKESHDCVYVPSSLLKQSIAHVLESHNYRVLTVVKAMSYMHFIKTYCSYASFGFDASLDLLRALNGAIHMSEDICEGQRVLVPLFLLHHT